MGNNQQSAETIVLDERLDLTAASALCAALIEQRGKPLTIDAEKVEHLGSQCLQVLISAALTWRADNAELSYSGRSSAFTQSLENFGAPMDALVTGGDL
ncbi:STAS domain-containing protein [Marinicaulis aureus]|uniref:STAS domain-containing protein n=1 Tax=Hyphococcus aureus TaxID=2666033 RepID=A0ABW1KXU2_9PROT